MVALNDALLNAPWDVGFHIFNDINDIAMYWSNVLMQVASDFIPNRVVTVHPKEKPWVNTDLKKMIRRRNLRWKRYKRSGSADHYTTFKLLRNRVVSLNRQLRNVYYSGLGEELSSPTMPGRIWWKTVKQVTGDKVYSGIPTLIENGSPIIDSIEKANIFNEYFASQCQLPDGSNDNPLPPFRYETDERLANITFFPSDIHKILTNLDVNKATGPDKIGNFLLKNVADSISEPLCNFFNYSIQNSTFPSMWKKSNVIPIHKNNDTKDKQNYRPVSLLCNVSKVFERLIYDKLYTFLLSNNLLTDIYNNLLKLWFSFRRWHTLSTFGYVTRTSRGAW